MILKSRHKPINKMDLQIEIRIAFTEKKKTESNRKLSNFNFQWTKTLNQNNLNNIALFFLHFKGCRHN